MLPSISVGNAANVKEVYAKMKLLLNCINYTKYKWQLHVASKVVAIVLGLQQGYTKVSVYCVNGTVEPRISVTRRETGSPNNHWNHEKGMYSTYRW
jgi:hypothetical protein